MDDNARLAHFGVEVIALTGALADAGENRISTVAFGDVVDQLHDDDGLADACTAECADLAALCERADEVDNFDARLEDLGLGVLLEERGSLAVDGIFFLVRNGAASIGRVAGYIENTAKHAFAHRNRNRGTHCLHAHSTGETLGGAHRDRANPVFAEVLLHFEGEVLVDPSDFEGDLERVIDFGKRAVGRVELDIDDGADDLNDFACLIHVRLVKRKERRLVSAPTPPDNP